MNINRFLNFLNPISRLGKRKYFVFYPLLGAITIYAVTEIILKFFSVPDATASGPIIVVSIATVIYFSFHSGVKGGIISSAVTVLYFFYIINSRHYTGEAYQSGVESTVLLGSIFLIVGILVGWLKETVDRLIEKEADGRIRLQSIIQQLPVGIIVADEDGKIAQQNKRLEEILGYKIPKDFIVGRSETMDGTPADKTPLSLALRKGKITTGKQTEIKKGGKNTYLLINATPVRNRTGKIVAAVSVIDDITQEKQMEKRKDDFINIASHELKTPITSMKLYIDLLIRRMNAKKSTEELTTLKRIQYQTSKLETLVGNLLDVSKISNGKIKYNKEVFRLDDLVKETVEELQATTNNHKIKLEKKEIKVLGDKFRIYQVITNFITNAIKFSPNSRQIIVSVGKRNGMAQVSVKDFGIGIAKSEQSKIFERLYQVEDGEEKTFPGFGMGLYISRQIIKRHHGNIWAESAKGSGSTFYFSLPIKND